MNLRHDVCTALAFAVLLIPNVASTQDMCSYETTGTIVPNNSGTPIVISPLTGTLISANFFDGGAIDPPFLDGMEFVSVCVEAPDQNGNSRAVVTTDVGLDDDTRIKAYPQFAVGTKFGNQSETSFRFYSNIDLPVAHQWPITAVNLDDENNSFELANLEYVSDVRGVGLPAFTNNLPEITITLDIDEHNVIGAERDIMLESWFYDTSANSDLIGSNLATGSPVVNTLNNIVGIGHPHFAELNNTLLEMMVHVGPLSPNDVSQATRNPGQNQLTERFSGKDSDGDGIDDHFDVDSHVNVNNRLDPQPGIYSSGVDANGDGIDDADFLPIQIGSFLYSIWYGESFLSPIVIFSRETNKSLQNDFNPLTPDMNLSTEGEFVLPWNDFLEYTINDLQSKLQTLNVVWASGPDNLFSKISQPTGAIGGVEFGVEPQINGLSDLPYSAIVNKFDVQINGRGFGLSDIRPADTTVPSAETTSIGNLSSINPVITDITGTAFDSESGVVGVTVRLQRPATREFWNGSFWTTTASNVAATVSADGSSWTLPDVDLTDPDSYLIRLRVFDDAGNRSDFNDPTSTRTSFTVLAEDSAAPAGTITSPANDGITIESESVFSGTASDTGGSGFDVIEIAIRTVGANSMWFDFNGGFSNTVTRQPTNLSNISSTSTDWSLPVTLPPGNYRAQIVVFDGARNNSGWIRRDFTVGVSDSQSPTGVISTPSSDGAAIASDTIFGGTASDTGGSGFDVIEIAIRTVGANSMWFDFNGGFSNTVTRQPTNLSNTTDASTDWSLPVSLPPGNYRAQIVVFDGARNNSGWIRRDFVVQ